MAHTEAAGGDTKSRLVAAATELFRRRGYRGTGLKDVTTSAGATTGSLYHFFPGGKQELGVSVVTESGRAYLELFELIADEARTPTAAISDFFDGAAATLEAEDFVDICSIGTVASEVASTDDALRVAADAVFTAWIQALARRLRDAGIPPADADRLALGAVAALQGAFVIARCRRDAEPVRTIGRWVRSDVEAALGAHRLARAAQPPSTRV